jgi:hypothetical protein
MQTIYHGVPEHMVGTILMPLNQTKTTQPELYSKYLEKYQGREEILEKRIPLLDCLWNDVVQFLPINPNSVFEAQKELGIIPEVPPYRFFEIDLATLDADKTAVFFKTAPGEAGESVKWLKDVDLAAIQAVPKATLDYYKTLIGTGELPFNYQFIPHIIYLGTVDISAAPIITLG